MYCRDFSRKPLSEFSEFSQSSSKWKIIFQSGKFSLKNFPTQNSREKREEKKFSLRKVWKTESNKRDWSQDGIRTHSSYPHLKRWKKIAKEEEERIREKPLLKIFILHFCWFSFWNFKIYDRRELFDKPLKIEIELLNAFA